MQLLGAETHDGAERLGPVREQLEGLLKERRYEDALDLLDRSRWDAPDAPELSRGIQLLKERLLRRYEHAIGSLDQVPRLTIEEETEIWRQLTPGEHELARLADGIGSFADIIRESRLGRFETYRALHHLLMTGILAIDTPVVAVSPASSKPMRAASHHFEPLMIEGRRGDRGWMIWVGVAVALGALGLLAPQVIRPAAVPRVEIAVPVPPVPPPAPVAETAPPAAAEPVDVLAPALAGIPVVAPAERKPRPAPVAVTQEPAGIRPHITGLRVEGGLAPYAAQQALERERGGLEACWERAGKPGEGILPATLVLGEDGRVRSAKVDPGSLGSVARCAEVILGDVRGPTAPAEVTLRFTVAFR